jgi:hypothetical protein
MRYPAAAWAGCRSASSLGEQSRGYYGLRLRGTAGHNPVALHQNGGKVARPRAAEDFAVIRARMDELRLERDRALAGQTAHSGPGRYRSVTTEGEGEDERRLPRSVPIRRSFGRF